MSLRKGTAYKVLTPLKCIKTQPFNKLKSSRKKVTEEQQPDQTRDAPSSARDHPHIHKGGGPRVGLAEGTTPKLSKAGQQKATAVGQEYERKIIAVDNQAIRNVSNVYREYGIDFERPPLKSTVVGPINIPLAVTGTANAAGQTTMPKDGVIKIASIEVMAKDEVKILCGKAGNEIQEIHKAEGLEVRAKGTSKVRDVSPLAAIGAANLVSATAAAGLSSSGQKKVKAVQDVTGAKIADVDRNAIEQIASVYKDNDIEMATPRPRETAIGIITAPLVTLGARDTASKTSMDQREVAKIAALEVAAKAKIRTLSERAEDEVKLILGKEGVSINQSTSHEAPPSVATALSRNGVISGVGAAGLAAAVAAAGLSKSGQKKVASIEKKATKKISGIDSKAMKDIASIYYVNGLKMEKPLLSKETRLGPLAVHLAVVGASAAASTANMPANEVERVSIIENAAKAEIDSISDSAEKSINAVLDKEGVSLDPPGSSREPGTPKVYRRPVGGAVLGTATVGAAAVSGLSKAGQKKVASVETKATAKILAADERAMKEISAIYKANGKTMEPSVPTEVTIGVLTVPLAVLGASSTASQDKLDPKYAGQIAIIEVAAKEEIKSISDRVEEDIRTIALSDRGSAGTKASSRDTSSSDETSSKGAGAAMAGAVAGAGVAVAAGFGMLGRKKQTSPEESDTEENRAIARGITSTAVSANKAGGNTNRSADDAASVQTSLTPATVAGAMSVAGAAVASGFGLFGKKMDEGFKSGTTAKEPLMASSDVSEFAPLTSTTSRGTRARAAQIGAAGLIGAATGAGLSKSGVKKVKSVEKKAIKKITSLDNKAVKEIASVYRKDAKKSLKSTRKDTSIGVLRVPLCVIGASVAASQAGLEEHEIGQIAAIELDAKEEIRRIDRNASDEIKGILEGEGISFDCRATSQEILAPISPTTWSRSTGFETAAATSGVGESQLSKSGKRKAAAIDKKMAKKIAAVDDIAMKEVAAVYLEHAIDMEKPVANDTCVGALSVPLKVFGASDAATEAKMDLDGIVRISDIESEAKTEIHKLDDVAFIELSTLHKKEGKRFDRTPRSVPPGKRAVIAGVAVGAVTAGGAAVGSLFKSNEAKISNAEEQARQRIVAIDTEAMKQISSIYQENGLIMKPIISRKAKVGVITVPVGVIGAGTAARKTTMGSLDLGRIASIERRTTDEIESIDRKAAKDIAVLNEKQGRWFADRPGASRAAGIAAEAGLGIKAVKKIAAIEEAAEKEIEDTDNTTAQRIAASDKKHDLHMHQLFKKNMEAQFRSEEEETAATRYFNMQERAADEIALIDEDAENDIRAVYKKNGRKMNRSNSDYFTKRGAAGPTATIAAVAMTAKLARLRRKNLRASRSSASPLGGETQSSFLGSVGSTTHLALYDAGSFVARVGSALTGTDLEGPAQYDARAK